jgi:uncharacterized protein (DUF433 family)
MTTTVTIDAHLMTTKEVVIKLTDNGETIEEFVLQDGESANRAVFDGREISVKEILKKVDKV